MPPGLNGTAPWGSKRSHWVFSDCRLLAGVKWLWDAPWRGQAEHTGKTRLAQPKRTTTGPAPNERERLALGHRCFARHPLRRTGFHLRFSSMSSSMSEASGAHFICADAHGSQGWRRLIAAAEAVKARPGDFLWHLQSQSQRFEQAALCQDRVAAKAIYLAGGAVI
jgi:hypothetical protein